MSKLLEFYPFLSIFVENKKMVAHISAQDQLAALIADAMPQQILAFKFASPTQKRIEILVEKKQEGLISFAEREELEKYLTYDLLIGLAKARAIQHANAQ